MAGRIDIDGIGEPHLYQVPPFGVLFQSDALFSSMTLAENLASLDHLTPIRRAAARQPLPG
jgi:phospholipid/cholesterol/gamma-HCH transport system ATP-binding protein